jgi:hypothetical protein
VSFTFGEDIVAQFLRRHDLDLICRAHQVRVRCESPDATMSLDGRVVSDARSSLWLLASPHAEHEENRRQPSAERLAPNPLRLPRARSRPLALTCL